MIQFLQLLKEKLESKITWISSLTDGSLVPVLIAEIELEQENGWVSELQKENYNSKDLRTFHKNQQSHLMNFSCSEFLWSKYQEQIGRVLEIWEETRKNLLHEWFRQMMSSPPPSLEPWNLKRNFKWLSRTSACDDATCVRRGWIIIYIYIYMDIWITPLYMKMRNTKKLKSSISDHPVVRVEAVEYREDNRF